MTIFFFSDLQVYPQPGNCHLFNRPDVVQHAVREEILSLLRFKRLGKHFGSKQINKIYYTVQFFLAD